MNKINYPKTKKYNKENNFYGYIENYIREFKNRKDIVEISYLCAKEVIELTKENKKLYKNCIKCLKLIELWLKDENSINIQKLKRIVNYISISNSHSNSVNSISNSHSNSVNSISNSISTSSISNYYSANSIYYSANSIYYRIYYAYSIYCAYLAKPELLPYIQKLIQMYLRTEKQFNIKEHNNTYHEKILKQIINIDYNELNDVDKNQITDIINEYYNIEINEFDFLTHKTIQREFV